MMKTIGSGFGVVVNGKTFEIIYQGYQKFDNRHTYHMAEKNTYGLIQFHVDETMKKITEVSMNVVLTPDETAAIEKVGFNVPDKFNRESESTKNFKDLCLEVKSLLADINDEIDVLMNDLKNTDRSKFKS